MALRKRLLTDDEGTFLALLLRVQPATAYQISKIYADSPVSNFGVSKGKIYPLIARLKDQGLVSAKSVAKDARGSEALACTAEGKRAVRKWVLELRPTHLLLDDPLRTKVQSFGLLSPTEQLDWAKSARAALEEKLAELHEYSRDVAVPYKDAVHDNAVSAVKARIRWIDRLAKRIADGFE